MIDSLVLKSLAALQAQPFGTRFFKSDFHFHTPSSEDARGADGYDFNPFATLVYPKLDHTWEQTLQIRAMQERVLKDATVVAGRIVDRFLAEGLALVCITDHNALGTIWPSTDDGEGSRMDLAAPTWFELIHTEAERRNRVAGKPILTILAGVEISTTGVHILAVFPPQSPRRRVHVTISDLLLSVGIPVEDFGRNPRVGKASAQTALEEITRRGGLSIIAHIDGSDQALLDLYPITSGAMKNVLTSPHLSAVEVVKPETMMRSDKTAKQPLSQWIDTQRLQADEELGPLAWVQGSDAHAPGEIGKRYTYVKMSSPSFEGLNAALRSPASRLRLGALADVTPAGLYLYGVELKSPSLGNRSLRLNRHLNCIVGRRESGKSTLFALLQKGAYGGSAVEGEVRLFIDFRSDNGSQLYCFESDPAGVVTLARIVGTGDAQKLEPVPSGAPEWDQLRPRFFDETRANQLIASLDDFQRFLVKYLGDANKLNATAANALFNLPAFLSPDAAPLLQLEAKDGRYLLNFNLAWRAGKPDFMAFEKLTSSLRRIVLMSILLVTGKSGPLLIDEPGDQFDNEDIATYLVPLVRQFKDQRQMVFATGNANLVVNTDPDNYIVLDSERGRLRGIRSGAALDDPEARQSLLGLVEGSPRAFRGRSLRYRMR